MIDYETKTEARDALKAFLHLVEPGPDDDGLDGLDGLPDSHQFELVWAREIDDENPNDLPNERFQDPTITAGQIRRARKTLAALDAILKGDVDDVFIQAMTRAMAPVFTDEGMPIRTPDEGRLDEVEQARWNCLVYAAGQALKAYRQAKGAVRDPEVG